MLERFFSLDMSNMENRLTITKFVFRNVKYLTITDNGLKLSKNGSKIGHCWSKVAKIRIILVKF